MSEDTITGRVRSLKILFAIWGDYRKWQEVTYSYNGRTITSKTTLPLLLKEINPDRSFVIVSNTLIDGFQGDITTFDDPKKIEEDVKTDAESFIKERMEVMREQTTFKDEPYENEIKVLVLPGIGEFLKSKFIGNPNNFYSVLYWKVVKDLLEMLSKDHDSIEIYLDITHGLNYMTMMTYRAIRDIAQILAFFYSVKFVVLNSDPFPTRDRRIVDSQREDQRRSEKEEDKPILNINEIESAMLIPFLNSYKHIEPKIFQVRKVKSENRTQVEEDEFDENKAAKLGKEINDINKSLISELDLDNIHAFAGAFHHGLVIFLFYFYPNIPAELIEKAYNEFYNKINVMSKNGKLIVSQNVDFTVNFVSIVQAYHLQELLQAKFKLTRKDEIKLSEIEPISQKIFFTRTIKNRLDVEIERLNNIKDRITGDCKDYGYYAMEDGRYEEKEVNFDQKQERNLFAHCGFGYSLIQVRKVDDSEILIKLKSGLNEKIKQAIIKNIPTVTKN